MKPLKIYIAGKYSGDNVIDILNNIREGIKVSAKFMKQGHNPFCPWLDHQFQFFEDLKVEDYYRYSMAWLEVSDKVYVLRGSEKSIGTQNEIRRAKQLNIPIEYQK